MKSIADLLESFPLTEGMTGEHLELIAGCGRNQVYQPGDYLFREGEEANTFWALRGGKVALEVYSPRRGPLVVETVTAGDVLGWSWIFPPYRYMFDARVLDQVRAIAFDGVCLRGKVEGDAELGYQLMKRMASVFTRRLAAARYQLLDLYGQPAES
jgi:CRP/FNR family transcriptional regulator, cyclic AMP receptor protein